MHIIVTAIILVFGGIYGGLALQAYLKKTAPLLVLGLWGLGFLNILGGAGTLLAGHAIGVIPCMAGVASIELGTIASGYTQRPTGPNWDWHALRIGAEVFVLGLLVTSL